MRTRAWFPILASSVVATTACSSNKGNGGTTSAGTGQGGGASTTGAFSSGTQSTTATGATSGTASTAGTASTGSGNNCSPYESLCNGVCVSTSDPKNCGGCGKTCPSGQLCSGGGCTGSCLTGLTACNGGCVDFQTDNANCGGCNKPCGMGMGCVSGGCQAALTFPTPAMCANGGPPIVIGGTGPTPTCVGTIAQSAFDFGICSCTNISSQSAITLDGWDSTGGPYKPGTLGGGMGANQQISAQAVTDHGPAWASGKTGTPISMDGATIYWDITSGNDVGGGTIAGKHDAYVAGNVSGLSLTGQLYQTPGKNSGGLMAKPLPAPIKDPCNCTNKIPVAAIIDWGKTNNDNALINLKPDALAGAHPSRIDLPCGRYYLSGFSLTSPVTLVAHGNVAVFLDGTISANSDLTITVADASSALDFFVKDTISSGANFTLGNVQYPALTRLYLGGTSFALSSGINVGAEIWAGNATVDWTSGAEVFGAIFANAYTIESDVNLHHDQGITKAGKTCMQPPGCGSCQDCGNQACINGQCGACQTSADCCAPLQCMNGTCVPVIM